MLKSLYISSFVIIDKINVDFSEGMNVLTGETGAGKSIIVDAIGQLCGNRSSASFVRQGSQKAVIEGVFDLSGHNELIEIFDELGIDFEEETIVSKTIDLNGKSNIKINYRRVTNQALKLLAPYLIHIHSQFETQTLFNPKNHLSILDSFIGNSLDQPVTDYQAIYHQYKEAEKQIRIIEEEDFSDEQIEFYQAQYDELKDLKYTDEDIDELENEAELMKNFESVNSHIKMIDHLLNDDNQAFDKIDEALHELSSISDLEGFNEDYDSLYNAYYSLMDVHEQLMSRFSSIDFDEYRYNEIQEELYRIQRLKRKYGYSMDDIYKARDDLSQKIERSTHRDEMLEKLYKEKEDFYQQANKAAKVLHDLRLEGAHRFESLLKTQLNDLYLPQARLKVDFKSVPLTSTGSDQITLTVAMNKGQDFTPLNESASGGEISRLMLGIKVITLANNSMDTLIFDEVDTGVSGKMADAIGSKMATIAKDKQVICITHLPQVAVHGTHHYAILKANDEANTYTHMKPLSEDERVIEIAKMLSGDTVSNEAIKNAKALLKY